VTHRLVITFHRHQEAAMVHLDLTPDERDLLQSTLEACISDVRLEIRNTDRLEYKDELKRREAIFKKLLAALQAARETVAV
jgi:hypothetical protein